MNTIYKHKVIIPIAIVIGATTYTILIEKMPSEAKYIKF